ncbi:MAG TPA: pentapeptide repeat-containing protein, partial [Actinomadura sp.]|nr:pentapeptide repeat-containing protein [Actinomadura sp.]
VRSVMRRANLSRVVAQHTSFLGADLSQVDFTGADLTDSTLFGATLDGALFKAAILQDTRYRH